MKKTPTALVLADPGAVVAPATLEHVQGLIDLWLSQVAPTSARAYGTAVADFAHHVGIELEAAVLQLLRDRGQGHALALAYRASMISSGKAPNTINLRLAALRSLVNHARTLGLVDWSLEVAGVRAQPYRDTRGPGRAGFKELLRAAKNARDKAILWLLYGLALRRGEVCSLDLEHVQGDVLQVKGKGSRERIPITMPPPVRAAVGAWISERGTEAGALFRNQDRARKGTGRLDPSSINDLVGRLSERAGLGHVRPHGLRHAAVTEALEQTRGDVRAVQRFSRHADPRTLLRYDDNRSDMGGAVAALVAGAADL